MNASPEQQHSAAASARQSLRFVLILGIVNLFADMTYEGGGSINGPFLGSLGASAAIVSMIAGIGEFLGYSLRSVSGYISDKTGRYWAITFVGYIINLVAVPAMALAGNWQTAALLSMAERVGRAIRKPTIESMLSYTTGSLGRGWAYAVNTALDEIGATIGPLVVAVVLLLRGDYRIGLAILIVPALFALSSLIAARIAFPLPSRLEVGTTASAKSFSRAYWLYMLASACFAAGLTNFELISYHWSRTAAVDNYWIPLLLAISTAAGVPIGLMLGRLYDRFGLPVVLSAVVVSALFSPFVFLGSFWPIVVGMVLWGVGYAIQDTLLKAIVAGVLPQGKRGLAFGLFYTGYGGGWLLGSVSAGLLYSLSLTAVIAFSMVAQLSAVPLFIVARRPEQ
jgi:MFS family permease